MMWVISQTRDLSINLDMVQSIDIQRVRYNKETKSYYYVFNDNYEAAMIEAPVGGKDEGNYVFGVYESEEYAKEVFMILMIAKRRNDMDFMMPPFNKETK